MKSVVALVLAALWSVALLVAATVVPFYSSTSASSASSAPAFSSSTGATTVPPPPVPITTGSATLVEVNGPKVFIPVGIPLVLVGAVSLALRHRRVRNRAGAGPVAWTIVGLLGAFTLVGMLSIGIFVLPVTGLLVAACTLASFTPEQHRGDLGPVTS